jgi:protein involved in polysaccharide export with SLBB domain
LLLVLSMSAPALPPSTTPQENPPPQERPAAPQAMGSNTVAFTTSMDVLNDTVKLGMGDRVSFRVVEDRREPIALYVTDSGEMEVPLIGRVTAVDKTCKQLAQEIKPLLEKDYYVRATVIIGLDQIGAKSRGKVYVTGQVRAPGVYEIMPDDPLTVSKAILRAGSLADFANKREVRLVRKREALPEGQARVARTTRKKPGFLGNVFGKREDAPNDSTETIIVDLVEILEKGHLEKDPLLKAGDLIVVPERLFNF